MLQTIVLLLLLITLTQVVLLLITSTFIRVQIQSNLGTTGVLMLCTQVSGEYNVFDVTLSVYPHRAGITTKLTQKIL